ncbi:MAG: hypothetical protein ACXVPU_11180 [Bacteroidia bacterium]
MKNKINFKKYYWGIFSFIIISCSNPKNSPDTQQLPDNAAKMKDSVSLPKMKDSVSLSTPDVSFLKQLHFFWGNYKLKNLKMLNCGKSIPELWKDSLKGRHYKYCLFNGVAEKAIQQNNFSKDSVLIQFIVWMHGDKVGLYNDSLSEQLVAIICRVKDRRLNDFNLVGITNEEIKKQFGHPDTMLDNKLFYFRNNEILCFKMENEKVYSFYWIKLNECVQSVEALKKKNLGIEF